MTSIEFQPFSFKLLSLFLKLIIHTFSALKENICRLQFIDYLWQGLNLVWLNRDVQSIEKLFDQTA